MTNKDKALIIINKLFELAEKDIKVTFSGHLGEMIVGSDDFHSHIFEHEKFEKQLQHIIVALDKIEGMHSDKA
jgi:hypothetical protein